MHRPTIGTDRASVHPGARPAQGLLLLLVLVCLSASSGRAERFDWRGDAQVVERLRIELVRGDISVRPAQGDQIVVSAVAHGPADQIDGLRYTVRDQDPAEILIAAVVPQRRRGGEKEPRVRVDFEVQLPGGVAFHGVTEVGDIDARGLDQPVVATSQVGDIRIETQAWAEAQTTNGNIRASLGRVDWSGRVRFRTTNGNIELQVPRKADLEISARSTNGRFDTDLFPVSRARYGGPGAKVQGRLGDGGRELELATVNGNVSLTSGDPRP